MVDIMTVPAGVVNKQESYQMPSWHLSVEISVLGNCLRNEAVIQAGFIKTKHLKATAIVITESCLIIKFPD